MASFDILQNSDSYQHINIFLSVILLDDDEAHKTGCSYSLLDPAFLIAILGFQAIQL